MKFLKSISPFALAFATVLLVFSCSKDDPTPSNQPDPDPIGQPDPTPEVTLEEQLQNIIDSKIGGSDKLIGVSVSIRVGFGKEYLLTGGVSAQGEPMPSDALFGIGSATKPVVAATILRLQEDGLLNLEDPISNYLDIDFTNVNPDITIRQLLNHFAGLKGYMFDERLWPRAEADLNTKIEPAELVQYIGAPEFEAGTSYKYSNSNFLILGLVIEAVTGKTVGEVMREKLWEPLGLNDIYFAANETVPGPTAAPWRDTNGNGVLEDISDQYGPAYHSVFYCAADVFSTASNLSLWAQHLFNGDALQPESLADMTTFYDLGDPVVSGYGLGLREIVFPDRIMWGHTGGMRGYGTFMFYDPRTQVSIALLNNQSRSVNGVQLRAELYSELLTAVFNSLN